MCARCRVSSCVALLRSVKSTGQVAAVQHVAAACLAGLSRSSPQYPPCWRRLPSDAGHQEPLALPWGNSCQSSKYLSSASRPACSAQSSSSSASAAKGWGRAERGRMQADTLRQEVGEHHGKGRAPVCANWGKKSGRLRGNKKWRGDRHCPDQRMQRRGN